MEEITVVISPQPGEKFSREKYISNNCYLKEVLRNAGYEDVKVFGCGVTLIGHVSYIPVQNFDYDTVKKAFIAGKPITVVLRKA